MTRAYDSLTVLDLTHVLAGPFCAYQFALLGADVIKIEPPGDPDCARGRGPDAQANAAGLGLTYQVQGANKRALALDLARPEGQAVLRRLAAKADVLIENFSTGSLDALGLGAAALRAENPALIYCSITGYGATGPRAATGAYDNVIQAAAGVIAQSGGHKPGLSFVDYATGYAAAFAVAAALAQRASTGVGAALSVSMLETALSMMAPEAVALDHAPLAAKRREAGIVPYATADGTLVPGVFKPAQYRKLGACLARLGHPVPQLARIETWQDVWSHAPALEDALAAIFATRPAEDWVALLHADDLPAERVLTLAEAIGAPQVDARGYFAAHPARDDIRLPLGPARFSEGGPAIRRPPPRMGEHSREILAEHGLPPAEIDALFAQGVVA
ncbi:CoA transferase [Rhodobacteraceae bacterium CCMM004]|nr:CoA transferase [Rhodobacteraceae bacterium CCMM004]